MRYVLISWVFKYVTSLLSYSEANIATVHGTCAPTQQIWPCLGGFVYILSPVQLFFVETVKIKIYLWTLFVPWIFKVLCYCTISRWQKNTLSVCFTRIMGHLLLNYHNVIIILIILYRGQSRKKEVTPDHVTINNEKHADIPPKLPLSQVVCLPWAVLPPPQAPLWLCANNSRAACLPAPSSLTWASRKKREQNVTELQMN